MILDLRLQCRNGVSFTRRRGGDPISHVPNPKIAPFYPQAGVILRFSVTRDIRRRFCRRRGDPDGFEANMPEFYPQARVSVGGL